MQLLTCYTLRNYSRTDARQRIRHGLLVPVVGPVVVRAVGPEMLRAEELRANIAFVPPPRPPPAGAPPPDDVPLAAVPPPAPPPPAPAPPPVAPIGTLPVTAANANIAV